MSRIRDKEDPQGYSSEEIFIDRHEDAFSFPPPISHGTFVTKEQQEKHDAAIRKDEREKIIDRIQARCNKEIFYFSNKDTFENPDRYGWLKASFTIRDYAESLRQQERPK